MSMFSPSECFQSLQFVSKPEPEHEHETEPEPEHEHEQLIVRELPHGNLFLIDPAS